MANVGNRRLVGSSRFNQLSNDLTTSDGKRLTKTQAKALYRFWNEINENEIAKSARPGSRAVKWYKQYKRNPEVQFRNPFMTQGGLYIFDYKTPKYESTLDFFDTQPLVLCLGQSPSVEFFYNNMGINLHLLPPFVRRLVLFDIWRLYKDNFKKNLYRKKQKQVSVDWQEIKKPLEKYGVDFAIRSYIPPLERNVIEFKQVDWSSAIWLPSAGYNKISAGKLETEWRSFLRNKKIKSQGSHLSGSV